MKIFYANDTPPSVRPVESAADRVMYIPELLHLIFDFLERESNVSNACVCKLWSEIALDILWREVDNLARLFSVLKPMNRRQSSHFTFVATPEVKDWIRFQEYARRVRSLRVNFTKSLSAIDPILDEVARTRISLEILPNLHTLQWNSKYPASLERCRLFLHDRIKYLIVSCVRRPQDSCGALLADICARAPNLHTLELHIPNPVDIDMTSHIKIVARNLPKLARLILPEFYYTSAIIEELSRMQNLEVIDFDCDLSFASGNPKNVESFFPVLEEGAFPALWNLSITAGIDDMERFFEAKYTPINLTTLHVTSYKMHTPEAVHSFLLTLSRECQHLCCLHLALLEKSASLPWMSSNDQLTYATLQPLFSFPKLTWFELNHKYPVRITQEEVEDLASRWPSLECLDLNSDPILFCRATLDLRAYLPFANHCPNLQQLGLYIHAAGFEAPQSQDSVKPFSALSVLIVGRSTVENPDAVAAFLSLLVPPWCRLCVGSWQNCGIEYPDLLAAVVMDIVVQPRRWEKIIASLPSLLEVRRQDRERTRALQTEVEDLRIQNRLLLDKAGTQTEDSCIVA